LDIFSFQSLISKLQLGKQLPTAVYLHRDAFSALPLELQIFIPAVAKALSLADERWNLVKLFKNEFRLSLLHYPDFYTESYPSLTQSLNVDLAKLSHKITNYEDSDNPPILHRKETMILTSNPYYDHFVAITQEGEQAGLYENTRMIGFKRSWKNLIASKGYQLTNGRLVALPANTPYSSNSIDRNKTALVRHELSAPMKSLAKLGYLDGAYSIFDYGCGRGDDLRELEAHGLDALGWDPNFFPDADKVTADIVNLGFVLNVIEDQDERLDALLDAWALTQRCLVVSVMLANESHIAKFNAFNDGVITSRNTFQKYYAQSEIKAYIERSLQEDAIPVAPGIFYIFKDKLQEQTYLQRKFKRHYQWEQLTSPTSIVPEDKAKLIIAQHSEQFERFWRTSLELGRIPAVDEYADLDKLKVLIGPPKKIFRLLCELYGAENFQTAQRRKKEDLLLFFAMGLFEKRKPYTKQPDALKRDIKVLFGDYQTAINLATELLFAISDTQLIEEQSIKAHKSLDASYLNPGHSLIFHKRYLQDLPLLLRTYVGAGLQMYGDIDDHIDLIKIHITSGKLTLTAYDDFDHSVPFLVERIKIKMAHQNIDFFDYLAENKRPPLLNKHLFLPVTDERYEKQARFDGRLAKLLVEADNSELIYSRAEFDVMLAKLNKRISGFRIFDC
jgi:DNA phosphorothioation-associated putative methyltransferase